MALTVLDAGVLIAMLDRNDVHHEKVRPVLTDPDLGAVVVPASAYAEVLVGPARRGPAAVAQVDALIADLGGRVEPLSADVARRAAALRARHASLRPPDALVLATAEELDAAVITTDRSWTRYSRRSRVI